MHFFWQVKTCIKIQTVKPQVLSVYDLMKTNWSLETSMAKGN